VSSASATISDPELDVKIARRVFARNNSMPDGTVRVLLVAGDEQDCLLAKRLFAQMAANHYHVVFAADIHSALRAVEDSPPDVFLLDDRLGTEARLGLVKAASHRGCHSPVIVLTETSERETELLESESGIFDCLVKEQLAVPVLERSLRHALEHRRCQEAIRQLHRELERRVLERTAELEDLNEKLQAEIGERKKVVDQLREGDHRKDQFLATLAHELRNPLSPLMSAAQLIGLEPDKTEQVRELTTVLSRQLGQLVRLIDDLLDVSRISGGKLQLRKSAVPIQEPVTAALDVSRQFMDEAGHDLQVTLPPELLWIEGDSVRLTQVISNLLINAAKYTPPGGVIGLVVRVDGPQIVIEVKDSGVGIPVELQSEIFKLFAQVDSSRTRQQGGLGIGLTLVRTLVEMHGGTIDVYSRGRDTGTKFTVRLPLGASEERGLDALRSTSAVPEKLPPLRVLVVDDSESAVHLLARLLDRLGQTVKVAYSAESALKLVLEFQPHLVISDVGMPEVSGLKLAQRIRALKNLQQPKLVAVTGYGQENDRREILAAGFDEHFTKPIGLPVLEEIIAETGA
jgi:signal transduction histidine kinase